MSSLSKYYQILGISPGSPKSVVKKAYWKLAKKYHPDINPSRQANQKFLEITRAYEVIVEGKVPVEKSSAASPTAKQDPFEKYRDVYVPPKDPVAYAEWVEVAKKRAEELSEKQYRILQGYIAFLAKVRKQLFYPSIFLALLAASFIMDSRWSLTKSVEVVAAVSEYGEVSLSNGVSFKGGRTAKALFEEGDMCFVEYSPLYHVVNTFGYLGSDNVLLYEVTENFYLWGGFYGYLLLGFSCVLLFRKRFVNGNFFGLYFFVIFWGMVQWWIYQ